MTDQQILKRAKAIGKTEVEVDNGSYFLILRSGWKPSHKNQPTYIWTFVPNN